MSKYPLLESWVDSAFPRKVALEIHRRHWKWQRSHSDRPYKLRTGFYAYGLKRTGQFEKLQRWVEQEDRVKAHWEDIRSGRFPKPCTNIGTAGPRP